MELPDSYANLMQFVPEKARPMVEAGMKLQAERRNNLATQLAQQQAALQQQRDETLADVQDQFAKLPDEMKQFPAVQHELKRQQILANMEFDRNSTALMSYGQPTEALNSKLKMVDERYKQYEQDLQPVEKTEMYGTAKQNWSNLTNLNKRVNGMVAEINKSRELLDKGDRDAALQNLKTFAVKQINSVPSDDAVSNMEVLFKYSPLMGAPETAMFGGKKITNPSVWFNKYLQAKTQQEKQGVQKGLFETISQIIDADPEAFLETAINGSNGHIDSYNKQLREQVINTTSPGVARRMGAVPMEYIPEMKRMEQSRPVNPLATQNPFGQSVSGGASATVPVVGQSQQASPLNAPLKGSTIFRIKQ